MNLIVLTNYFPSNISIIFEMLTTVLFAGVGRKLLSKNHDNPNQLNDNRFKRASICFFYFSIFMFVNLSYVVIEPKLVFFDSLTSGSPVFLPLLIFSFTYTSIFKSENWFRIQIKMSLVAFLTTIGLTIIAHFLPSFFKSLGTSKSFFYFFFSHLIIYFDVISILLCSYILRNYLKLWIIRYLICIGAISVDSFLFSHVIQYFQANSDYQSIFIPQLLTKILMTSLLSIVFNFSVDAKKYIFLSKFQFGFITLTKNQLPFKLWIPIVFLYSMIRRFIPDSSSDIMQFTYTNVKGFCEDKHNQAIEFTRANWDDLFDKFKEHWIVVSDTGRVSKFKLYDEAIAFAKEHDVSAFVTFVNLFCRPNSIVSI